MKNHYPKSAEIVASIEELLIHILMLLPMKSLVRFKLVSHSWLSLISDPMFCRLRNPKPNPAVGLIWTNPKSFEYIPFDVEHKVNPPFTKALVSNTSSLESVYCSCNGLLICGTTPWAHLNNFKPIYYVYNPTTSQYSMLNLDDWLEDRTVVAGISLAYDPAVSPFYHVVCVLWIGYLSHQIITYSSETKSWRVVAVDSLSRLADWYNGVYWNNAIHWCSPLEATFWYLTTDGNHFDEMPSPPMQLDDDICGINYFFGESCDHLHYIELPQNEILEVEPTFVYELEKDYSEWFVKYKVDLSEIFVAFPVNFVGPLDVSLVRCIDFSVSCFVRGSEDEDAFFVLRRLNKSIKFNLESKTFEKLHDFQTGEFVASLGFQYVESMCAV